MKVLITGSSGRIGRALFWKLSQKHQTLGVDLSVSSSTTHIQDIQDYDQLRYLLEDVDVIYHAAALHAPHVNVASDQSFHDINVKATEKICQAAKETGVPKLIFTSTTALYGYANTIEDKAVWVDENTSPKPKTIYHSTKLEAEGILQSYADDKLSIRVIRMSRCYPEPANLMAVYRLHRGVDYRDVADAHILASQDNRSIPYDTFVISGKTPFEHSDVKALRVNPESVIREKAPELARELETRGWPFPRTIDRVYDSSYAQKILGWSNKRTAMDVFRQYDEEDFEVLPVNFV